ncbi:Rpn family recombination-promoting nuclease/putative transposase [Halorhodospira sp. 9622]|uniref:Rpn family recombination-promoting nuclease/putative transposase n=1 Tax=Halorhodospira sp. 9622 TaxID=2899136 RepID=UPI001EE89EBC|nr:Rpn family recombination-promoting nuclease/putative transposase [Halorhodospira sp. 9622]MCG5539375.1 Rpn family recombination-promoting nuclease/putative transposase [Halorhodospira sp. 9622]
MAEHPNNAHDALLKATLEAPERAAVVLRESLPDQVRERLTDDLPKPLPGSYVDPSLGETHSDRLFEAQMRDGRPIFLYVLIEHKSQPDVATPVQLLGYLQRIWQRYAEQSTEGRAGRYRSLPPIIPLVIYNGKPAWSVPLSLFDCIDADEELLELQRDFGYQVRHLKPGEPRESYSQDPAIRAVFRALAWAFVENLDQDDLIELLRDLPPGHPLEKPLLVYIARVYGSIQERDVRRAVEQTRPDRAEELVMTVADEWIKQGEKRGEKRGSQQTAAKTLLRLIERKFGPEAKEASRPRVERAAVGELEMWFDRAIDAECVEDVFSTD